MGRIACDVLGELPPSVEAPVLHPGPVDVELLEELGLDLSPEVDVALLREGRGSGSPDREGGIQVIAVVLPVRMGIAPFHGWKIPYFRAKRKAGLPAGPR